LDCLQATGMSLAQTLVVHSIFVGDMTFSCNGLTKLRTELLRVSG
jgi:hypothetical protein